MTGPVGVASGLVSQVMNLEPGRGFAELDALYRDSHWRAQLSVGERLKSVGLYGFAWGEQGAGGLGAGVAW